MADSSTRRGPILIVDDNRDFGEILAELLQKENYAVLIAPTGQEAIECIRGDTPPSLILLDLGMGHDLYEKQDLGSVLGMIPVVVLSGNDKAGQTAFAMGAVACLKKPVDVEDILVVVRRYRDCVAGVRAGEDSHAARSGRTGRSSEIVRSSRPRRRSACKPV